jgi:hypothetical protein
MPLSLDDLQFVVCEPGARSCWTCAKTESEAQEIADKLMLERGKTYVVETWGEFDKRTTHSWLDDVPLQEITADFYDQMMNVLPPMYREGAMGFFMCEFTAGAITNQFACVRSDFSEPRYYVKAVDITDRATWITPDKIAALPDGSRLEWFGRKEGEPVA